jgi:5S rRNA maturation endonuclease (ribonuclease M5)
MNSYIDKDQILEKTRNGLDIILNIYPQAEPCVSDKNKKFKIRPEEKTASASLYQHKTIWFIKDWGGSGKGQTGISLIMQERNLDFHEALVYINDTYCNGQIKGNTFQYPKPDYEKIKAPGKFIISYKDFTKAELSFLGKHVTKENCKKFNVKSVAYTITKDGHKYSSTDDYFIFCYDFVTWQKIYQPFSEKWKFVHKGEKPKDFIFGLEQLEEIYKKKREKIEIEFSQNGQFDHLSTDQVEELIKEEISNKLSDTIICSGEKDVLNIEAFGYNAVCMNSETAILPKKTYYEISKYSKNVYNIPDIDITGIEMGLKLALQYPDLKTIWLPTELRKKRDFKGKPCSDTTDFFKHYKDTFFKTIKSVASTLRFIDKIFDKNEQFKGYAFNNDAFYKFLQANGYQRYPDKNSIYSYLNIKDKIVRKITIDEINSEVKHFLNQYMNKQYFLQPEKNYIYRTNQTGESSLVNMELRTNLDFKTYGKNFDYFFFNNVAWKIQPDKITEHKITEIDKYIWDTDIKNKVERAKLLETPIFELEYSDEYNQDKECSAIDKYKLTINDSDFIFMKYLINTSKLHWDKGDKITTDNKKEQVLSLINKIYALGYASHKHKVTSKAWCVFAMDAKESETGKSSGGSGKSIGFGAVEYINKVFPLDGKQKGLTTERFVFDGVDEHTYHILLDDADQYLDFPFFFSRITGKFTVEPKNHKQFTLPFDEGPKLIITTNHTPKSIDGSTERRILYVPFSDYYHDNTSEEYEQATSPRKEFGKDLFTDFTEEEWNKFYNFMACCIQVYMKFDEKIEAPKESIDRRNQRTAMGEDFLDWSELYFDNEENRDTEIEKYKLFENFQNSLSPKSRNMHKITTFKKRIKSFCKYKGWTFNPKALINKDGGRIQHNYGGNNLEYFWI